MKEGNNNATFGARVKTLREEKGMSRTGLAESMGCSVTSVTNWENDAVKPNNKTILKLAEYFVVFPGWLRNGIGPRNKSEAEQQRRMKIESSTHTVNRRDEHTLDMINLCIKSLRSAGFDNTELGAAHEFLTEVRSQYERKVLLGIREEAGADTAGFTSRDVRQLEDINNILSHLGNTDLSYEDKRGIYTVLAGFRMELEHKALKKSAEAARTTSIAAAM